MKKQIIETFEIPNAEYGSFSIVLGKLEYTPIIRWTLYHAAYFRDYDEQLMKYYSLTGADIVQCTALDNPPVDIYALSMLVEMLLDIDAEQFTLEFADSGDVGALGDYVHGYTFIQFTAARDELQAFVNKCVARSELCTDLLINAKPDAVIDFAALFGE